MNFCKLCHLKKELNYLKAKNQKIKKKMSVSYCRVPGCLIADKHTTGGHFCKKCKHHGHDKLQCDDKKKVKKFITSY